MSWPHATRGRRARAWPQYPCGPGAALLGAFYVAVVTLVGPRIGAAALLAMTVLGQHMASLLVDQFGWLGFPLQPLSATRIAGAVLLLGGVGLIVR